MSDHLERRSYALSSHTSKYSAFYSAIILAIFGLSSCATMDSQSKQSAEAAKQVAAEEKKVKEAAKQKALAEEDIIQAKPVKAVEKPKEEKIVAAPKLEKEEPKQKLEIPTEPNTYLISSDKKTISHPFFGVGKEQGFSVNGVEGGYIVAKRGEKTTFRVRTGVKHDFYLTTNPKGWGAAVYTDGVENQFTYQDDVTFVPNDKAPKELFYGCRNHEAMGGKIVVADKGDDVSKMEAKLKKEHEAMVAKHAKKDDSVIDPKKVKQKIAYVKMLIQFKGKNLNPEQLKNIKAKLADAEEQEKAGDLSTALATANAASDMFEAKAKSKGPTKEQLADAREEFNDHLITLEAFIDSHKFTYQDMMKRDKSKAVDYDHDVIGKMVSDAKALSKKNDFKKAGRLVKQAERIVTKALNDMYKGQTAVVYDLNFETPAEEYEYEVKRYLGYEELIPVAIEVKKPKQSMLGMMQRHADKAKFFREKADESAKAGRWSEALVIIKDATVEVRRGLRFLGVNM